MNSRTILGVAYRFGDQTDLATALEFVSESEFADDIAHVAIDGLRYTVAVERKPGTESSLWDVAYEVESRFKAWDVSVL